jgi:tRNA (adenine22-N1)-methyltransferase
VRLSRRLERILQLVADWAPDGEKGSRRDICVADVGTDHGFVPICLVERGIAARALALDVREGPLERAKEHVQRKGLDKKIDLRLGDGLKPLAPMEADMVVISGMGGELMLRILREGELVRPFVSRWIFSPQSELALFRHGLEELGLSICHETMVEEEGKYYTIMVAQPGQMSYSHEYCYRYGEILIQSGSLVLTGFLEREIAQLKKIQKRLEKEGSENRSRRLLEVERKLQEAKLVREAVHLARDNRNTRRIEI